MYSVGEIANPYKYFLRTVVTNLEFDQTSKRKQVLKSKDYAF